MEGKGPTNTVFVATMHNTVYAIDADDASSSVPLWRVNLGPSVPMFLANFQDVQPEVGILSTPVIDLTKGVIYVVAETFDGASLNFVLHALSLSTGEEMLNGPSRIAASVPGTGPDNLNGNIVFDPLQHLQRPGLLLSNGTIYIAFGSHGDEGPWHGWMLAYDASNLQRKVAVFNSSPNGAGGSFWQSGRAPAADSGFVYAGSANGDYDGDRNLSNSFLKLSSGLQVQDWFTPADWQSLSDDDNDVASAGVILIPGTDLVLGGDKLGTLYLLHRQGMANLAQTFTVVENSGIFSYALWPQPGGAIVYVQVQGEFVRAYRISQGQFNEDPIAVSSNYYTNIPYNGFTVSSNGSQNGVLWTTSGSLLPNVSGSLHAYDALTLAELWNSDMMPGRDSLGAYAKFATPTVVNGKVFVPTFSNHLAIYGALDRNTGSAPQIWSVANAASFVGDAVSAGEQVVISGSQLMSASGPTQVLFDGVPAALLYTGAEQIGVLTPASFTGRVTRIQVVSAGVSSNTIKLPVLPATPGIFTSDSSGVGQAQAYNEDGSTNSADNPANSGSMVLFLVTGAGVTNNSITASVSGVPADVLYAGPVDGSPSGTIGILVMMPDGLQAGDTAVTLTIAGYDTQAGVTIAIQ